MGNISVAPVSMIAASPEVREAASKVASSAKDSLAKHLQSIKQAAGTDTAKAIALGAAAGAVAGAVSPIPAGAMLGGVAGAAAGAAAAGAKKAAEKSTEQKAVRTAIVVGLVAGPITGLTTYAFCSGKAKQAFDNMMKFVKEHPEALLAKAQ